MSSDKNTSKSKQRSLLETAPEELADVLQGIIGPWEILSFNIDGSGWTADIKARSRNFHLSSECGYIEAQEVIGNSYRSIDPPEDQRINISPKRVASLINKQFAK